MSKVSRRFRGGSNNFRQSLTDSNLVPRTQQVNALNAATRTRRQAAIDRPGEAMQSSRALRPTDAVNRKNPPADSDDQRRDAPAGAADAQSNLPLGADPASGAEQTGPADFERSLAELEAIVEKLE